MIRREMGRTHRTQRDVSNWYKILVWKAETKRPVGRPGRVS